MTRHPTRNSAKKWSMLAIIFSVLAIAFAFIAVGCAYVMAMGAHNNQFYALACISSIVSAGLSFACNWRRYQSAELNKQATDATHS